MPPGNPEPRNLFEPQRPPNLSEVTSLANLLVGQAQRDFTEVTNIEGDDLLPYFCWLMSSEEYEELSGLLAALRPYLSIGEEENFTVIKEICSITRTIILEAPPQRPLLIGLVIQFRYIKVQDILRLGKKGEKLGTCSCDFGRGIRP